MEKPIFNLSKADIQAYAGENRYATLMFCIAGDDYVSARCVILNTRSLFTGFSIAAQSIEKLLKVIIFLETKKPTNLQGLEKHNPYALKEELQKVRDYGLTSYDDLLKRLYGHFQHRYFDNKDQSQSVGSQDLDMLDELWIYLLEKIPFPVEVKYSLSFFSYLFDDKILKDWPNYLYWITVDNKALKDRLCEMKQIYLSVIQHRLGSLNKI